MRQVFKGVLDSAAGLFLKAGLTPDSVTLSGLVGHIIGAVLLANGKIAWGGLVILLTAPLDALDGAMARLRGRSSKFGAFLDSVTDRYSELFLFGGLLFFYSTQENIVGSILVYTAMVGSLMVSYVRSRAESLGFSAKIGLLSRLERYIILVPALLLNYPLIGVIIVAILANFTALQRIWFVHRQAGMQKEE